MVEIGSLMGREELVTVLSLANKKERTQLLMWADHFIAGVNKMRKSEKQVLSFEEFFKLLITHM
jgi:hypothetical protein